LLALVAVGARHDGERFLGLGQQLAEDTRPLGGLGLQEGELVGSDVAVGLGRYERHEGDSVQLGLQVV
jgi:hypothetical protein